MVYKNGVFNMRTQKFIKKIYKALMKNHHLWFVKKKDYSSTKGHNQIFAKV